MPVCIAGMHRSGTSMVTRLLNLAGLYLGEKAAIMPAAADNESGFWENLSFLEVNDDLLNELGGGWDFPVSIPDRWATDARLLPVRRKAESVVARFIGHQLWGWKDPRNSLTLPFWRPVLASLASLGSAGPLKVVICLRNPLDVAVSLRTRNYLSSSLSLALWKTYNERVLAATSPAERLVTHYDAYFDDPWSELQRLLEFVGLDLSQGARDACAAAIAGRLRHHHFTGAHLAAAEIAPDVADLYQRLCAEAGRQHYAACLTARSPQAGGGDRVREVVPFVIELQRQVDDLRATVVRNDAALAEKDAVLVQRGVTLAEKDAALGEKHAALAEKDAELAEKGAALGERDAVLAVKDAALAEKNATVAAMGAAIDELRTTVVDLRATVEDQRGRLRAGQDELARRDESMVDMVDLMAAIAHVEERVADDARTREAGMQELQRDLAERLAGAFRMIEELVQRLPQQTLDGSTDMPPAEAPTQQTAEVGTVFDREDAGIILDVTEPAWTRRMVAAIAECEALLGREPSLLDWDSGLDLHAVFPERTVFSPPTASSTLPYLDQSVDIIVCPQKAAVLTEARRAAGAMVITVGGRGRGAVSLRVERRRQGRHARVAR